MEKKTIGSFIAVHGWYMSVFRYMSLGSIMRYASLPILIFTASITAYAVLKKYWVKT